MDRIFRSAFQREVEHSLATTSKTVGLAGLNQYNRGVGLAFRHLFQGRNVVEDVKSAPVGRDYQIVKAFLHYSLGDGSVRQACIKRRPVTAVIQRVEKPVTGARKNQARTIRIFGDGANI